MVVADVEFKPLEASANPGQVGLPAGMSGGRPTHTGDGPIHAGCGPVYTRPEEATT